MYRLAVDIDGVCADTVPLILDKLNKHYGKSYTTDDLYEYPLTTFYGNDAMEVYDLYAEEIYTVAQPVNGAVKVLNMMAREGMDITYLTCRDYRYKDITVNWLIRNNFPVPQRVICTNDKTAFLRKAKCDFNIDDNPIFTEELASLNIATAVLFDCPYNRYLVDPRIIRVSDWYDIWSLIQTIREDYYAWSTTPNKFGGLRWR